MRINKKFGFFGAAAMFVLLVLGIKSKLRIKMPEVTEIALKNGKDIINNYNKILAISAHPDDLEFFAGGLIQVLQQKGKDIHIIDITDGEKGVRLKDLAEIRRKEQLEAARVLGVNSVYFLHLPDLSLHKFNKIDLIIGQYIQEICPDLILTFDYFKPMKLIVHPDHIKVGESTKKAVSQIQDKKPQLLYYASREPNAVIDVANCIKAKVKAVQQHRSQLRFSPKPYEIAVKAFGRYSTLNTGLVYAEHFRIEKHTQDS